MSKKISIFLLYILHKQILTLFNAMNNSFPISILKFRNDFDINDNDYIPIIKNYLTNDYAMEHLIKCIDDIL